MKCSMCLGKGKVKTETLGIIPCPKCYPREAAAAIMKGKP